MTIPVFLFDLVLFVAAACAKQVNISCPAYFREGIMNEVTCVYNKTAIDEEECFIRHKNPNFEIAGISPAPLSIICNFTTQSYLHSKKDSVDACWCVESSPMIFNCTLSLNGSTVREGGRVVFKYCRSKKSDQTDEISPSCKNITFYNDSELPPKQSDSDEKITILWSIIGSAVGLLIFIIIVVVIRNFIAIPAVISAGIGNINRDFYLPVTFNPASASLQH